MLLLSDSVTFDYLFDLFQEEKKKGDIQPLAKDFYIEALEYIKKLEQNGNMSVETTKKTENFKKLFVGLKERRKQKLLIYLAYNKSLPEKIPFDEELLYMKIKNTLNEQSQNETKLLKLKINSDIPEIITPNGSKLGPFNQNQIIEINNNIDLEFLINNKVGELIQV